MPRCSDGKGDCAGNSCTHVAPSYSQVSFVSPPVGYLGPYPPNRTVRARLVSNAITCPHRPGGDIAVLICVQLPPSYSHVSARPGPMGGSPPNNIDRHLPGSKTIAARLRAGGALLVITFVQSAPSYSQVSPRTPKRTVFRRHESNVIDNPLCAAGLWAVEMFVQSLPLYSQVSPKAVWLLPELFRPPKSTIRCRWAS